MQLEGKPPVGIFFDSDMGVRIDSVLALALLYGLEGKSEARVIGLSVSIPNLVAAQFCEVVGRFYANSSKFLRGLPVGLASGTREADTHALGPAIADSGITPNIRSIKDTADPRILLRNALTAQHDQNAVVVCAGPSTNVAAALEMHGTKELIAQKVRFLIVTGKAPPEWPTPVMIAGESDTLFPSSSIEKDFAYAVHHPIAEAYRAYKPMPYDAPTAAMGAVLYAVRPNEDYFKLSQGNLIVPPDQKGRILETYIELASAKPVERTPKKS